LPRHQTNHASLPQVSHGDFIIYANENWNCANRLFGTRTAARTRTTKSFGTHGELVFLRNIFVIHRRQTVEGAARAEFFEHLPKGRQGAVV
jgi:hypothetical protein